MAAGVNAEVAWNCGFAALTVPVEIEDPVHLQGLGHLSWTELHSFLSFFLSFFFFQIWTLQVGMVVSWGSQEIRVLLIRVVATDYKFCLGEGNTNTPIKFSGGKAQVISMV